MSESVKKDLFEVKDVKLYGLYREPLYNEDHLYYYQNLFVRGQINQNLVFIKVCNGNFSDMEVRNENNNFLLNMLRVVDGNALPDYNKTDSDDDATYMLHGASVKVLVFCKKIVAIGNNNNQDWLPCSNFFERIKGENINSFKNDLLVSKISEYEKNISECSERISYYCEKCKECKSLLSQLS